MSDVAASKISSKDLVDPYLTPKTRRTVARAFGYEPTEASNAFLRRLTVGKLREKIPTWEKFVELNQERGLVLPKTLEKAKPLFAEME